ncbi:pyridoxamine 5'-phosphate oxidase-domain-containing protein [Amylocystis lapponica]|nr:pyridoxamine 5'-phosphate oxidase-domain-containing protein [Amylocystis lapponica]
MTVLATRVLWSLLSCAALYVQTATGYETMEEAAQLARKLIDHSPSIGAMATVYPADHPTLSGEPFVLQEYYARRVPCHTNGSLALILMPISRHGANILASPGRSVSITVADEHPAASRARVALIGNVTVFKELAGVPDKDALEACFLAKHPDVPRWLPGSQESHASYWATFDPHTIYYVGGFGGAHYIGYIPLAVYQAANSTSHESHAKMSGALVEQAYLL